MPICGIKSCRGRWARIRKYPTQEAVAVALGIKPMEVSRGKAKAIAAGLIKRTEWDECLAAAKPDGDEAEEF